MKVYNEHDHVPSRDGDYVLTVVWKEPHRHRVVARSLRTAHAKAHRLLRQGGVVTQLSKQVGSGETAYWVRQYNFLSCMEV